MTSKLTRIAVLLPVFYAGAAAAADPTGSVQNPRTGSAFSGAGQSRLITFSGTISPPQGILKISCDVLRRFDLNPADEASLRRDALITTSIGGSTSVGTFSMTGSAFDSVSWLDGGTGRARV